MTTPDLPFEPFPKVPRLMRDVCITEKIDGTNGLIYIPEDLHTGRVVRPGVIVLADSATGQRVYAGSRKRWITPEKDNYGFAAWVAENADTIAADLGPGRHFGEWWGAGIQRRYGLEEKRFSLFNIRKWGARTANTDPRCERKGSHIESKGVRVCACRDARPVATFTTPRMGVVPVLYEGSFAGTINDPHDTPPWVCALLDLESGGSVAAPGFMQPEGIMVYHIAAGQMFKYTLDGDGHKG
jgi:hypothetical protein